MFQQAPLPAAVPKLGDRTQTRETGHERAAEIEPDVLSLMFQHYQNQLQIVTITIKINCKLLILKLANFLQN